MQLQYLDPGLTSKDMQVVTHEGSSLSAFGCCSTGHLRLSASRALDALQLFMPTQRMTMSYPNGINFFEARCHNLSRSFLILPMPA